jgi:hypothetical protein
VTEKQALDRLKFQTLGFAPYAILVEFFSHEKVPAALTGALKWRSALSLSGFGTISTRRKTTGPFSLYVSGSARAQHLSPSAKYSKKRSRLILWCPRRYLITSTAAASGSFVFGGTRPRPIDPKQGHTHTLTSLTEAAVGTTRK